MHDFAVRDHKNQMNLKTSMCCHHQTPERPFSALHIRQSSDQSDVVKYQTTAKIIGMNVSIFSRTGQNMIHCYNWSGVNQLGPKNIFLGVNQPSPPAQMIFIFIQEIY